MRTIQTSGMALFAVMAMGCSSKGETTAAATTASAQGAQAPAGAVAPNGAPQVTGAQPGGPGAAMQNPGMSPGAGQPPAAGGDPAAAGTAAPGAQGGGAEATAKELEAGCSALCKRAVACMPASGGKMTEASCVSGCSNPPSGKAAPRAAVQRMTKCAELTDCNAFNSCMAAPAPAAAPEGAPPPPAH